MFAPLNGETYSGTSLCPFTFMAGGGWRGALVLTVSLRFAPGKENECPFAALIQGWQAAVPERKFSRRKAASV